MPDYYAGSSLYESEEEIEKLVKEFGRGVRKESVNIYKGKLDNSEEIERYNEIKLKKIVPLIVKLKEEYVVLSELKERGARLKEESELVPDNDALKEMAFIENEKYNKAMEKFLDEADEILGAGELDKTLSGKKIDTFIDHVLLLKILKEYRKIFKAQIDTQKEERKKTIAVLLANIENEFELGTGTEFIDFLKEDIKKYNKDIQKQLRKFSLDKLKEILLNLKLLTTVYGYDSNKITLEFILEEIKLIKSNLKKEKVAYEDNSKWLDKFSESVLSEVKIILIEEIKGDLEKSIERLKNEKKELESILKKNIRIKEILDIKKEQKKMQEELEKLRILKSNLKNKKDIDKDLDDKIENNLKRSITLNKRLNELKDSPKEVVCDLGGLLGILSLGMKNINKNMIIKKSDSHLDEDLEDLENLADDELTEEEIQELEYTELESMIKQSIHKKVNIKDNGKLSFEEFNTKLEYYGENIISNDEEKNKEKVNLVDNLKCQHEGEEMGSEEWFYYRTNELLEDDELSCGESLNNIQKEIESEEWLDYETDELLEDDELSCTEEENKQEIENKKNEVLENENLDDKKEKLLIADVKRDEQEEEFEEYVLIKEDEKKDIYIKLSDLSSKLRNLEWRVERIDKTLKNVKNKTKRYDRLVEEHEDRKNKIMDEISKYEIFKDLSKSLGEGKSVSYQLLYT